MELYRYVSPNNSAWFNIDTILNSPHTSLDIITAAQQWESSAKAIWASLTNSEVSPEASERVMRNWLGAFSFQPVVLEVLLRYGNKTVHECLVTEETHENIAIIIPSGSEKLIEVGDYINTARIVSPGVMQASSGGVLTLIRRALAIPIKEKGNENGVKVTSIVDVRM